MARFPINNTDKDKRLFNDEWEAHEENLRHDVVVSIENRTMTKKQYYKVWSYLREMPWRIKHGLFGIIALGD